jgi:CubicO group peptidase (beta-lactamase class C family)
VVESYRGLADRDCGERIGPATRFQLASVSKEFTAVATLLLCEQGRVSVSEPISGWLEHCPASWRAITIHHLLSHTSGLGHWPNYPELDLIKSTDPAAVLDIFQARPPLFTAGSSWRYSSPGFVLLAWIVERASGVPYRTFLDEQILSPLALTRSFVGNGKDRANLARGYADGEAIESFDLDVVGMGAGDVWSTGLELAAWTLGLERLLSPASLAAMLTEHTAIPPDPERFTLPGVHYGYGCYVSSVDGKRLMYHTGNNSGYKAFNAWIPADRVAVAILSNEETTDLRPLAQALIESR